MTLLDILTNTELRIILENQPFSDAKDFHRPYEAFTIKEMRELAEILNKSVSGLIKIFETRLEKL